ncbi:cation diffusion facilitator family transporter [Leekyejoonella antrihumi]|uniref:Cation diffusion facilitator family transporter n=1 Tax=Leekyejoonella antrihumi TaxID=1660198 RepID=A0A563DY01_9MICO|nr:cation diffusion facilitator family transporter [Leekyejoonella antrihumi]TWP35096.1 cation diffusion facilitator family transporter [Leekyejoonella antrihumi]
MSTEGGTKAIVAALGANLGIAITKLLAFLLTGMSSMLAEAIHSFADSGNQVLLLIGGKRARRDATPEHPFGYGRERYIYGFIVSIVLFSVGGLFALYEAYHKWHESHTGHGESPGVHQAWWWVPLLVLVVAIGLESMSFRTAIRESNPQRGSASWVQFIRGAKAPELPVILLEDFAALIGLVFALFGVLLAVLTENAVWDAIGTGLIGALLVSVAVVLAIEMKSLLLGESAAPSTVRAITQAIEASAGVDRIIHLKTLHLGPEELLVAAKIAISGADRGAQIAATIDDCERRARDAVPELDLVVYLEPDLDRAGRPTGAHPRRHADEVQ